MLYLAPVGARRRFAGYGPGRFWLFDTAGKRQLGMGMGPARVVHRWAVPAWAGWGAGLGQVTLGTTAGSPAAAASHARVGSMPTEARSLEGASRPCHHEGSASQAAGLGGSGTRPD